MPDLLTVLLAGRLFFDVSNAGLYPYGTLQPTVSLNFTATNLSLTAGAVLPPIGFDMLERQEAITIGTDTTVTPAIDVTVIPKQMRRITIACQPSETEYVTAAGCGDRRGT